MKRPSQSGQWIAAGLLCLASGCATPTQTPKAQGPIFYPKAPDPPRLQFLVSYSTSADVEIGPSKFAAFVTGQTVSSNLIFKPYGLALSRGALYVCDTIVSAIQILDLEKHKARVFLPQGEGKLRTPINIAIDQDGTRYIADTGRNQVLMFSADEKYLGAIGQARSATAPTTARSLAGHGRAPVQTTDIKPTDVAIRGDRLYVADMDGHCVRVYDKTNRQPMFTIPAGPTNQQNRLFAPTNLAIDTQGRIYVSDIGAFRVQQYDAEGKFLRSLGQVGDRPGEFARPKGVAVDREGRLYVVDAAAQVIQIFDAEGKLLMYFGEPGSSATPLDLPAKVIIDYDHVALFQKYAAPGFELEYLVVVSNQYGDRKVSVYGFGHKT